MHRNVLYLYSNAGLCKRMRNFDIAAWSSPWKLSFFVSSLYNSVFLFLLHPMIPFYVMTNVRTIRKQFIIFVIDVTYTLKKYLPSDGTMGLLIYQQFYIYRFKLLDVSVNLDSCGLWVPYLDTKSLWIFLTRKLSQWCFCCCWMFPLKFLRTYSDGIFQRFKYYIYTTQLHSFHSHCDLTSHMHFRHRSLMTTFVNCWQV